ncbi:MAG: Toprim subdomain protein [Candidatus Methanoplasma sp.]|jgi:dTMP kinase|nr:Toprim subdomain protein [Candidatus Methanoplasma sp.]
MNDEERLREIVLALDDLADLASDHIILVEGLKDARALRALGIEGTVFQIQGVGPLKAAEHVAENGGKAVVLTDWDRKGGILASELEEQLSALGAGFDMTVRAKLSTLSKKYVKDVESLDSLVARLSSANALDSLR